MSQDDDGIRQPTDFSSFAPMTPASESELVRDIEETNVLGGGCLWVVFGKRQYGIVDVVPERFYVATVFSHLFWIPLLPVESFVLLEYSDSPDSYSGVSLPLYHKSVLAAYRTAVLTCAILAGVALAVIAMPDRVHAFLWCGIAVAAAFGIFVDRRRNFASPERAAELAALLGCSPDEIESLRQEVERRELGHSP